MAWEKLIFDILPKSLKRPRQLNFHTGKGEALDFSPNDDQRKIKEKIAKTLEAGYSSHLIHGITGSGKTTIYLELIAEVMKRGKSVLFLLPEINLTSQFLDLFCRHIQGPIYSYNSSLSNSDRFGLWRLLQQDDHPKLVLGARSSIFLPMQNLGLIIIDEEHDLSFKQEDRCSYHARNVAIKRAQMLGIPIVLGSATPSTDTLKLFGEKPQNYYQMKIRASNASMPEVQLIDIREKCPKKKTAKESDHWPLSLKSISSIKRALGKKEQILVFVNRLGYANYLQCRACGQQFFCSNCSIPLKYFKAKRQMACQHCGHREKTPTACPECHNLNLLQKGFGTEKISEVIANIFPDSTVKRFDRDDLTTMKQVEERLQEFHRGDIDILVGTQMLSKGHNFKRVNLVLILGTDAQLSYPDFRSQEKVFQQVSQISGRSGRYGQEGRVLIQTFMPKAKIYHYIQNNDDSVFYRDELTLREEYRYPPYLKMAVIYLNSRFAHKLSSDAQDLAHLLQSIRDGHFKDVEIYGPRACNVEKRANQFSQMILLKSNSINQLHNLIESMRLSFKPKNGSSLRLDIDPVTIL